MAPLLMFIALVGALLLYGITLYNGLIRLRESVKQAWANIGVLLKQRHDELPKLVETCRQYMQYEQETLERVIKARDAVASAGRSGSASELASAENALRGGLARLYAVAEQYPNLKADASFTDLQARITSLEEQIADRRELYNSAVNLFNTRIATFPDSLVAGFGTFPEAKLLEVAAEDTRDPDLKTLFRT
jgi:LemA protein